MKPQRPISSFTRLLLWCAGDDIELLQTCREPAIVAKRAGIGFLVLTPAMLAFFSAIFFIRMVLPVKDAVWADFASVAFGALWSIVIFNMDRYLVTSLVKSDNALRDFCSFQVITRMLLSGLIAAIIAHPLTLTIFQTNIMNSLALKKAEQRRALISGFEQKQAGLEAQLNELSKSNDPLNTGALYETSKASSDLKREIGEKQREIDLAQKEYADEVAGNVRSRTRQAGIGPTADAIKTRINSLQEQLANLNAELKSVQTLDAERVRLKQSVLQRNLREATKAEAVNSKRIGHKMEDLERIADEKAVALKELDDYTGVDFLTLSNELDELAENNPNVCLWKWLLTALFFTIDLIAVIFKVLAAKDNYDIKKSTLAAIEAAEERIKAQAHGNQIGKLTRHYETIAAVDAKMDMVKAYCEQSHKQLDLLSRYIEQHGRLVCELENDLQRSKFGSEAVKEALAITERSFNSVLEKIRALVIDEPKMEWSRATVASGKSNAFGNVVSPFPDLNK